MNRANVGWHLSNMKDHEHLIAGQVASGVGRSSAIWGDCPLLPVMLNRTKGFTYLNDFLDCGGLSITSDGSSNGITLTRTSAKGSVANDASVPGGIIKITGADAVDKGPTIQFLGVQCEPAEGTTIWMEWRILVDKGGGQMFMGLCDDSQAVPVTSSDAIVTNKNLVGFYRDTGTGDTDWTVGVCDGSSSEESDDEVSGASETAYEKYGIVLRGIGAVNGSRADFYHNGALVHTISDEDDLPLTLMCPCFQIHGGETDTDPSAYLDWLDVVVFHAGGTCRESG